MVTPLAASVAKKRRSQGTRAATWAAADKLIPTAAGRLLARAGVVVPLKAARLAAQPAESRARFRSCAAQGWVFNPKERA
jgi:hypothetical protein